MLPRWDTSCVCVCWHSLSIRMMLFPRPSRRLAKRRAGVACQILKLLGFACIVWFAILITTSGSPLRVSMSLGSGRHVSRDHSVHLPSLSFSSNYINGSGKETNYVTKRTPIANETDRSADRHVNKRSAPFETYNVSGENAHQKSPQSIASLETTKDATLPSHNVGGLTTVYSNNSTCRQDTQIMVLVNSRITSADKRGAIRDTWGKAIREGNWLGAPLEHRVSIGFVVGTADPPEDLTHENSTHHDIIQGDFVDHYHNLTTKSLFAMEWARDYCEQARYFIKSDDDVIINLPHIIRMLDHAQPSNTIIGPLIRYARPNRSGKWGVNEQEYPGRTYPHFVAGSAYVITMDLIRPLLDASRKLPRVHIDDVYITGILAQHVQAKHIAQKGFSFLGTPLPTVCEFHNGDRLSGHGYRPAAMRTFWTRLNATNEC